MQLFGYATTVKAVNALVFLFFYIFVLCLLLCLFFRG